jgi:hypothetical protein
LSKIVPRTTFPLWSESPTLPFVRFCVKPKITIFASFVAAEPCQISGMMAMLLPWTSDLGDSLIVGVAGVIELGKVVNKDEL